jgi:site-specific DNA recombinase
MSIPSETLSTAAIYARLSTLEDGPSESVERQIELGHRTAERGGHTVTAIYYDDGISAWDESKHRPGFEDMMNALRDGKHDGVIYRHLDRLSRNPRDTARLLSVGKARGIAAVASDGTVARLDKASSRLNVSVGGLFSAYYSDVISENVKPVMQDRRRAGAMDTLGYGWARVGTSGARVDPTEAAVINEIADGVLRGESWTEILPPLTARGARTKTGRPLEATMVRRMLKAPRTGGLIDLHGEIVGSFDGGGPLTEDKWRAVNLVLDSRKGKRSARQAKHLLTNLLTCGRCGGLMKGAISYRRDRKGRKYAEFVRYSCLGPSGLVGQKRCDHSITGGDLEAMVIAAVKEVMRDPRRRADVDAEAGILTGQREAATAELLAGQQALRDANADRGLLPDDEVDAAREAAVIRVKAAQAALGRLSDSATATPDAEADFDALTIDEQRAVIRKWIARIDIAEPTRRTKGVDLDRVRITVR